MTRLLPVVLLLASLLAAAQPSAPTDAFTVNGKVKTPRTFRLSDLQKFNTFNLADISITNHKGEVHGTAKNLSGVLLRDILQTIPLDTDNPKDFSAYYFVCRASDGYKVVYSWNELFNTHTGNSVYIVTAKGQQPAEELDEAILMVSAQDIRTGRRYLKNLQTIYVGRVED